MNITSFGAGLILLSAGYGAVVTVDRTAHAEPSREPLDSRTIPHPDWVQVSGHIETTTTVRSNQEPEHILVMLLPVEGGRVAVDLGTKDNVQGVHLDHHNYIHVRGPALVSGDTQIIIAGELIADGRVIAITRPAGHTPPTIAQSDLSPRPMPLTPAAPAPQ